MEKLVVKHRKILSAFLPKSASSAVLSFQVSPPISPVGKGSVSLIPKQAPRKSRNGSFDAREPASPKVSCMGQIKCTKSKNKKRMKKQGGGKSKVASASASPPPQATVVDGEAKRKGASFIKETKRGHESNVPSSQTKIAEATRVPSLGKMKQFSSSRGTLSDFDWRACEAPVGFVEEKEGKSQVVEETKLWKRRTTKLLTPLRL